VDSRERQDNLRPHADGHDDYGTKDMRNLARVETGCQTINANGNKQ